MTTNNSDFFVLSTLLQWMLSSNKIPELVLDSLVDAAHRDLPDADPAVQEALELLIKEYSGTCEYSLEIVLVRHKEGLSTAQAFNCLGPVSPRHMLRVLQLFQRSTTMAGQHDMSNALARAITHMHSGNEKELEP